MKSYLKKYIFTSLIYLIFIFFTIIIAPNTSFAENVPATNYRCIKNRVLAKVQSGSSVDEALNPNRVNDYQSWCKYNENLGSLEINWTKEVLTSLSAMKQSGPPQADATSCNQFIDKAKTSPGLRAPMDRSNIQDDSVRMTELYNDLKNMGVITGDFCTEEWLQSGQADMEEEEEIHNDCGKCNAFCDSRPNPDQCFQSECSNIVDCTRDWGKGGLGNFQNFEPIGGGFGDNMTGTGDVNAFLQDVMTYGSAVFTGLAILKIIFGGIMYATAAGNAQRITDAKSHILYALLGIALIAGANIILWVFGAPGTVPPP